MIKWKCREKAASIKQVNYFEDSIKLIANTSVKLKVDKSFIEYLRKKFYKSKEIVSSHCFRNKGVVKNI